jgi:integrase
LIQNHHLDGIKKLYKGGNRQERIWGSEEILTFLKHAPKHIADVFLMALLTGQRRTDVLSMRWNQIKGDHIEFMTSKTGKKTFVPITPDLRDLLSGIEKTSEYVLLNTNGMRWTSFDKGYRQVLKKAGLADEDLHFHDLRGTYITAMMSSGVSADSMEYITGNKSAITAYLGRNARLIAGVSRENLFNFNKPTVL